MKVTICDNNNKEIYNRSMHNDVIVKDVYQSELLAIDLLAHATSDLIAKFRLRDKVQDLDNDPVNKLM